MRLLMLFAVLAAAVAVAATTALADPGRQLEAVLRPVAGGPENGFGLVTFRQPKDEAKIAYLDTWVRDLAPNHDYSLQRAADANVNDDCTGTNWLTLGDAMGTHPITTDELGTGRAALSRDLSAIALGTRFDIHFRVVDAATPSVVVLESPCYQFTVSE